MPSTLWIAVLTSFFSTLGFAALLKAPLRSWVPDSAIGALGYVLHWLLQQKWGVAEPIAIFCGSMMGSFLAQVAARKMQMIATIFVTLSMVGFVPGFGLYRCMSLVAQEQTALGTQIGVSAMIDIIMITLGLAVGGFLFRMLITRAPQPWKRKNT